jgi:hypothetical protein
VTYYVIQCWAERRSPRMEKVKATATAEPVAITQKSTDTPA